MNISSKLISSLAVVVAFVSCSALSSRAQQLVAGSSRANTLSPASTITTLYANDPLAHSLCFTDGKEGLIFQNGEPRNRCSHIDFDAYKTGSFSVGIEGGELGQIIDLGTDDELSKQYGYQQTVGKGQGFASIELRDGKLVIVKDRKVGTRQELTQGASLFERGQSSASAVATAGHIYLVRISGMHDKNFQILVKLLVLTAKPGELATFRWELL
ncbi:MAG TPA: hypothetical protein VFD75_06615 [Pyrinomonadaceae bacterium]|nr:hypothetical protein [Pyrinomonadaceae bacterium]